MKKIAVTGIKPTGMAHLGNYLGAIKPAINLAKDYETRYFIADYHALNSIKDKDKIKEYIYDIAATWLACGLDPDKTLFYRQSLVPETFELATILSAFTPKGLMNRAHAYKAKVQENKKQNKDEDFGVNMGLFTYPILMAADILLFNCDLVPVGKDQKQHIEMTVDIAQSFNHVYCKDILKIPQPLIKENTKTVTGLDGRKMSKSYNNYIPLFLSKKKLKKTIMKIVTNSQSVEEPKDPTTSNVFALYKLFADEKQQKVMREKYLAGGMGWGHAKKDLFELINSELEPLRKRYNEIISDKSYIDKLLREGSEKARNIAASTLSKVKQTIGLEF